MVTAPTPTTPPPLAARRVSIGVKLAIVTAAVIFVVSACVYAALSRYERRSLFRSKELAASMVTKLFASSVAAPVHFLDEQGVKDALSQLKLNPDVDSTTVFHLAPGGKVEKVGAFERNGAPPVDAVPPLAPGSPHHQEDRLVLVEGISDPLGSQIGSVVTVFSLAREEQTFAALRRSMLLVSMLIALLLAGVLIAVARAIVVRPLLALRHAARAIESGQKTNVLPPKPTNDEIGDLCHAFGSMAEAIAEREERIAGRNRDMRLVLDNVGQGFFVVDAKGVIVGERSAILTTWLADPSADETVWSYLSRIDARRAGWVQSLWSSLADDFLPPEMALEQFPTRISTPRQHYEVAYRPLLDDDKKLRQCIVVLTDITATVVHELAEREQRQALELFKRFVASRSVFEDFLTEARTLISAITSSHDRVEIARALHTLKGNVGSYGLADLADACHEIESRLLESEELLTNEERERLSNLWGVVEATTAQLDRSGRADVIEITSRECDHLREAILRGDPVPLLLRELDRWKLAPTGERLSALASSARALVGRLGKGPVEIVVRDNDVRVPAERWSSFWGNLIHVIRNAVDHGLETPAERAPLGKQGRLELESSYDHDRVVVSVSDNGRGVAWAKVAERARAMGLPAATDEDLTAALFADGVSTRTEATDISGRGVGLAALREAVLRGGGTIRIQTTAGQGTRFEFSLPSA